MLKLPKVGDDPDSTVVQGNVVQGGQAGDPTYIAIQAPDSWGWSVPNFWRLVWLRRLPLIVQLAAVELYAVQVRAPRITR